MSAEVSSGGYNWHYRLLGSAADPSLLLLHGFTGCAAVWDEVAESLKDRFRVLAVDLPGHGRTVTTGGIAQFRMAAVAGGLKRLLDNLGVARTHLWGYSMGGRLALHFAVTHTGMVERVILESASPGIADPHDRSVRRAADDELAARIERDGVAAFIEPWMAQPLFQSQARLPEARRARARALRLANSAAGLADSLRGMGPVCRRRFMVRCARSIVRCCCSPANMTANSAASPRGCRKRSPMRPCGLFRTLATPRTGRRPSPAFNWWNRSCEVSAYRSPSRAPAGRNHER